MRLLYGIPIAGLLGLGDTQVRLTDDYRLPNDVQMVIGFLDALGIQEADFVASDHGAATLQLLMRDHPERIRRAVITNAEAYDQWPSAPERPYLRLIARRLPNVSRTTSRASLPSSISRTPPTCPFKRSRTAMGMR